MLVLALIDDDSTLMKVKRYDFLSRITFSRVSFWLTFASLPSLR